MKSKWKHNPLLRTFVFLSILIFTMAAISVWLFYYIFSIPEPEGRSLASWPNRFTDNFSLWMEQEGETVRVKETGLARLDEYGLWLQVINEAGQEVFSHNKPEELPQSYPASELMSLATGKYENGTTVFVSHFKASGETFGYLIGFPYAVGKYMLYYNGETVARLSPVVQITILSALGVLILFVFGYAVWLSRKMTAIAGGISNISCRTYQPLKETGVFGEISAALNKMNLEIRSGDRLKEETDRVRREWIANITHDLKTPLSPVKGYAELLADGGLDAQTAQEYGGIILKNVNHAERLINDLKLTYQLDSGAVPFCPKELRLVRFLKELVIDVLNDPAFSSREIAFESGLQEISLCLDPDLFRRAISNLIINALVHNPPGTKVEVEIEPSAPKDVLIYVRDHGVGMDAAEQAELFSRYFRGTNTKEKPEGSGLGLAIAKQIVTLHKGEIAVKSKLGEGTEFTIRLPKN